MRKNSCSLLNIHLITQQSILKHQQSSVDRFKCLSPKYSILNNYKIYPQVLQQKNQYDSAQRQNYQSIIKFIQKKKENNQKSDTKVDKQYRSFDYFGQKKFSLGFINKGNQQSPKKDGIQKQQQKHYEKLQYVKKILNLPDKNKKENISFIKKLNIKKMILDFKNGSDNTQSLYNQIYKINANADNKQPVKFQKLDRNNLCNSAIGINNSQSNLQKNYLKPMVVKVNLNKHKDSINSNHQDIIQNNSFIAIDNSLIYNNSRYTNLGNNSNENLKLSLPLQRFSINGRIEKNADQIKENYRKLTKINKIIKKQNQLSKVKNSGKRNQIEKLTDYNLKAVKEKSQQMEKTFYKRSLSIQNNLPQKFFKIDSRQEKSSTRNNSEAILKQNFLIPNLLNQTQYAKQKQSNIMNFCYKKLNNSVGKRQLKNAENEQLNTSNKENNNEVLQDKQQVISQKLNIINEFNTPIKNERISALNKKINDYAKINMGKYQQIEKLKNEIIQKDERYKKLILEIEMDKKSIMEFNIIVNENKSLKEQLKRLNKQFEQAQEKIENYKEENYNKSSEQMRSLIDLQISEIKSLHKTIDKGQNYLNSLKQQLLKQEEKIIQLQKQKKEKELSQQNKSPNLKDNEFYKILQEFKDCQQKLIDCQKENLNLIEQEEKSKKEISILSQTLSLQKKDVEIQNSTIVRLESEIKVLQNTIQDTRKELEDTKKKYKTEFINYQQNIK